MPEMRIPIVVPGAEKAARDIGNVGKATKGAADEQAKLEKALQRAFRVSGPSQRLARAEGRVATEAEVAFDRELAAARAKVGLQRGRHQLARTGGGSARDRLIGALSSSRLNLGPISPLVGQAAEVLGVPAVGETAAAIGVTAIAATAFGKAVQEAARHLNELGEAARLTGGTGRDVGGLQAFGLRGGAAAGAAAGFQSRVSGGDPFATMLAQQHGFFNLPRPFGDVNEAKGLRQALEYLHGIRDEGQQLREARMLGLEGELKYIQVSERLYRLRQDQAKIEEKLIQSGATRAANELSVATESVRDAWSSLASILGTPFVAGLATDMKDLASGLQSLQKGADQPGIFDRIDTAFNNVQSDINDAGLAVHNFFARLLHLPESQGDAADEGTKATKDLNDTMRQTNGILKDGIWGAGPRGQNAIPPGWTGGQLRQGMEAGAIRRGQIVQ